MKKQSLRVRFAPSPTGDLHIGSLRTALFNWLFARHHNGVFLVRIEDTDIERSKDEYTQAIIKALEWMQLQSDEPLIYQTDRFPEHQKLVERLLSEGKAYKDYLTQDEMLARYEQQFGATEFPKAFRVCRDQDQQQDKPYVVRFKLPLEQSEVCFDDMIRGRVCFETQQLDDFVIARPDGRPMYNFAVVADDMFQEITHVIRGEDHISNTPKQILLYEALGAKVPSFAHLPLILGKEGQRLSKRDAATGTQEYRMQGYLPDALLNYLVRLGWAHGDQEIFTRAELVTLFDISAVGKKGSMFDQEKLDWINAYYIRHATDAELYAQVCAIRPAFKNNLFTSEQVLRLIALYKDRAATLIKLAEDIEALAQLPALYEPDACAKWTDAHTAPMLESIMRIFDELSVFDEQHIKGAIIGFAQEHEKKLGAIAQPIRIALTGGISSPTVFDLLSILGKQQAQARLDRFVIFLKKNS